METGESSHYVMKEVFTGQTTKRSRKKDKKNKRESTNPRSASRPVDSGTRNTSIRISMTIKGKKKKEEEENWIYRSCRFFSKK